jgi:alginate O-acetyltransferase complex protein AlgI
MLFNSYSFILIYLPVVLAGFFSLARMHFTGVAKAWLFLSSLAFYAYWDIRFLPLLLLSILFNYGMGSAILVAQTQGRKKGILFFGIFFDLALLFYFKYFNFFANLFSASFIVDLILPLGISFFTFTQIAYFVDAYQGKAEKSDLISYGLFVTVFPHLIAGPILHHKEMLGQFNSSALYKPNWNSIAQGVFLFTIGLFKKVIIADPLALLIRPIFDGTMEGIPLIQSWAGALAYTLQLYFDFSGYSDMAVGLGLLFNLHLPINFNSPYQADSIIDFWRRWHITLSKFLRDYLYIPLGGNRNGQTAKLRNLLITMVLGGLWHGAGWTFILWGACHGSFLVINHIWRSFQISMPAWLSRGLTLLAVIVAWVIFRSPNVEIAFDILKGMAGWNGLVFPEKYERFLAFLKPYGAVFTHLSDVKFRATDLLLLAVLSGIVLICPNSNEWAARFKRRPKVWAISCALLFFVAFLHLDEMTEFLYYQF